LFFGRVLPFDGDKLKLTMDDILLMNALEKISGVSAKDCITSENLVSFLVKEGDVGKAIGKGASNVKMLEQRLNKRVEIIGWQEKPEDTASKALELNFSAVKANEGKLVLSMDPLSRRAAMKNSARTKRVKEFIKRNYGLEVILV